MSYVVSEKFRDFVKNYLDSDFQNGGSIVRFEQRAESLFSGLPSPIEPNPGHDTGKRPTSNLLRGDLPREELPSSLKKTLPLHLQRRSTFQTEKLCRFAFIPARFLHGFFNVMATHLVKDIIQVEITAERKRHCLDSTQHTPRLSANRCHSLLKTQRWSGSLPTASL